MILFIIYYNNNNNDDDLKMIMGERLGSHSIDISYESSHRTQPNVPWRPQLN